MFVVRKLNEKVAELSKIIGGDSEPCLPFDSKNERELTTREREVITLSSRGKTYPEIAMILGVKVQTVKFHMGNIVRKLDVVNAKQAIRCAVEYQLVNNDI